MSGSMLIPVTPTTSADASSLLPDMSQETPVVSPGEGPPGYGDGVPGISVTSNVVGGVIFVLLFVIIALTLSLVLAICYIRRRRKRNSKSVAT